MRHTKYVTLLAAAIMLLSACAFGDNIGFCNAPASSACGADPNIVTSNKSFGMWSFGSKDSNATWYLLLSVPEATKGTASAPSISSSSFTVTLLTPDPSAYLYAAPTTVNIYDLTKGVTGYKANNSMNNTNMFGTDESLLGLTPADFAIFVYKMSPGFDGKTAYQFSVAGTGLTSGTYLAAIGVGGKKNNIQFSTPFTTSGLEHGVPDGGMTLMLLGGVLLGVETLRRKFRV